MTQIFLISERDDLAQSIGRFLRFKEGIEINSTFPPALPKETAQKAQWVPQTFRKLAAWLDSQAEKSSPEGTALFNAIAIIDVPSLTSLDELDPIDRTKDWSAVVAMLVLAFPEIHWVLLSPFDPGEPLLKRFHFPQTASFFADFEAILQLHDDGFSPLFDPAGLRNESRRHLALRKEAAYVPLRRPCAVAIDEEENYSYFNAYTAYRFGYRCHVVTSYRMMDEVLGGNGENRIDLSFEDIYLNFPDKKQSLSKVEVRDNEFKALTKIPMRIFVTGGHTQTAAEQDTWELNKEYLKGRTGNCFYSKMMYKPESGVFDVWLRSGLQEKLRGSDGKAAGFVWPPPKTLATSETGGTHSAPGRLLQIAERMIRSAGRILKNAESVREAVHGATLALEAQEYLGHRTPTTSLDAVSLKHQSEVMAECMFYGVEYNLDIKSRFKEIKDEVESIGIWFRSKTREVSKLNSEIGILSDLLLRFRDFNQYDEERAGLSELRHLHRRLWLKRNKVWAWLFYPARWYIDQLLRSVIIFVLAIVGWLVIFGCLYGHVFGDHHKLGGNPFDVESAFTHGFEDAITAFFGMQPPHDFSLLEKMGAGAVWLTLLVIVLSFVHLGIFVSHLYSIVARK